MDLLVQFPIPLICLRIAVRGLLAFWRPARRLESEVSKERDRRQTTNNRPKSADIPPATLSDSETTRRLRSIRWKSGAWLTLGCLGLWASGFELGWEWGKVTEWKAQGSPGLDAIVRNRCVPFIKQGGGSSLAVVAISTSEEALFVFGRESLTGPGASERTVYEIGSITKAFTGIALARDVEQGVVRLEQPVRELLPSSVNLAEPVRSRVTLRHLTSHTSGLPRLPENAVSLLDFPIILFGGNPYSGYSEESFFQALRDVKLESAPGTRMEYSNFGTSLLGYVLARRAGADYSEYIERSVLSPLGMRDTGVPAPGQPGHKPSPGYRAMIRLGPAVIALRSWPWSLANHLAGAGGLRSTTEDMRKFLKANMAPHSTTIGSAISASHREIYHARSGSSVGMNWLRTQSKRTGKPIIWNNGGTGGFHSFIGFTDDSSAGVVILSNRSNSVDSLAISLLEEIDLQRPDADGFRNETMRARGAG